MRKTNILTGLAVALCTIAGCKNSEIVHPDFEYQTVYFASQYPVRTVVLGEDANFDNTLDKEGKVAIKATLGGTRYNANNVVIGVTVNESLLDGLYFSGDGPKIEPMPSNYFSLAADEITIAKGDILGGVEVQLTDAFFADPDAIQNTYAIPLQMTDVQNADSILTDKDFVLYALKFINPWHGNYLRRGADVMTGDINRDVTRHAEYVENDEINALQTRSLHQTAFPVQFGDEQGNLFSCTLLLDFDDAGNCTISTETEGFTASGTGSFVSKGEKNSWGNADRDGLYLDYQLEYTGVAVGAGEDARLVNGTIATKDTLVMRDRGVVPEYFTPVVN